MNIYALPMLISGILFTLLSLSTWMFRHKENVNRVFSLFTFALAADAFAFWAWFQFGNVEAIDTWMRYTFALGFFVPASLILFFFAFTGYNKKLDAKVIRIKVRYFRNTILIFILCCALLSLFTNLLIAIPEDPENIYDIGFGIIGSLMYPIFAFIFIYLFTMVFKAYKGAETRSLKRFIKLLALGTFIWLFIGYGGTIFFEVGTIAMQSVSYLGTVLMAMIYFIAILNYQFDKIHEMNLNLEQKVEDRTRHLRETQSQLIQSEKMASLGHLVAGVAHEMNTPVGAVYSTHDTLAKATEKLKTSLEKDHGIFVDETKDISKAMNAISNAGDIIGSSGERITEIVKSLKLFAQLDEADLQSVNVNEAIIDTLRMFEFHLKPGITVRKEFADIPLINCYPAKINQLCFQLLRNANMAIEETGEIILKTEIIDNRLHLSVSDNGSGIPEEYLGKVFDPGFTAWNIKVGTGLGLAICYQVAQEHNGTITVESEFGQGSKFEFSFPLK